ncbi:Glycosyltransferase involved in cell wall bisynthesis [Georgenia satyanarayanai]|uniref:D-inositol 3-phosphate glycosyltransferase n=1 Tax=Georgenia satyanarayanai TaxID=860221 RepID=A0A2Y9A7T3_9MICO|nr:glycosyltransferase [Georgenia satyanarayanai]PYG00637.1 glycosyltransferase involved in cell wall biosynthesis [Georgenia satyanarayanai]SSA40026.1 Glycosyltransferase involved in cell wall bisynthesis [Georgenia satyanarayanai]
MRVLHVSDCFPPRTGGIETQVHDLAVAQARAGHAVHVATATAGADGALRATRVLDSGVRVHRMASALALGLPVNPRGTWLLRDAVERLRPDVVHVHAGVVSPFALDGVTAAHLTGVPLAITWHCMLDGVVAGFGALARRSGTLRSRAAVSAVSSAAGERVARMLGREDVSVLPNGLTLDDWLPQEPPRASDGTLRLVATQRLAPRKRPAPLVEVVAAAHRRLGPGTGGAPRVHLTLIGAGPEERRVRALVERLGLHDVVTLTGGLPREELRTRYAAEDVFVAPARLEAFGIAGLEARAAGLPVVAGRGTGPGEYVSDGVDGLLTADRSDGLDDAAADAALTHAVVRLAEDGALLRRLREHAHATPPPFDWADVLSACDELYARALSGRD